MKSLTTGADIISGAGRGDSQEVATLDNSSITVGVPGKVTVGQLISMRLSVAVDNESHILDIIGKTLKVVPEGALSSRITIKFHQYNKPAWEKIISSLSGEQVRVDTLLSSMRGDS